MQKLILPFKMVLACTLFAACVTINVYFPAAAAEKAADQIIDQVTGSGSTTGMALPENRPDPVHDTLLRNVAAAILDTLVPAAHAQGTPNLDIASPEIRAITASMAQRFTQLEKYFASGAVGLTNDGQVEVRDQGAIALPERAAVKRLVAEDNTDRNALYAAIAKANGHPEWQADIRKTFARRWVERGAKPGWYYQDAGGSWQQK
ncbi:MAG: YdbL family protein [Steroidobacteraceae bacterium]|nr:YdbL family protein [Steroidobacteraceae bacterium]MCW5573939.1 YdbL family protein [Steroidobacteraceae bacterium]